MASLFIKTLAVLNIEAARALAREEGEGRSAPPTKEPVETAAKPFKNAVSKEDAPTTSAPKGAVRWANFAHKQAGSILVPQNQGEVGKWTGRDGWSWMRVENIHDWAAAKEKAGKDGRWWVILEGGKLWGWSPPNARPVEGEKSPKAAKEPVETAHKPVKDAVSKEEVASAEKPASPASSPGASALVEAAKKRKEAQAAEASEPAKDEKAEKPKRTRKATSKEVEDKKE